MKSIVTTAVERAAGGSSLIDVLDRVLDKGVASIDTYLKYSEAVGQSVPVARPHSSPPPAAQHDSLSRAGVDRYRLSVTVNRPWRKKRK